MEKPEVRGYNPVEIEKLVQLDRLGQKFNTLSQKYREARGPFLMVRPDHYGEGTVAVRVDSHFLYGMYKIRRALVFELAEMGLKDEALDVFTKQQRQ